MSSTCSVLEVKGWKFEAFVHYRSGPIGSSVTDSVLVLVLVLILVNSLQALSTTYRHSQVDLVRSFLIFDRVIATDNDRTSIIRAIDTCV